MAAKYLSGGQLNFLQNLAGLLRLQNSNRFALRSIPVGISPLTFCRPFMLGRPMLLGQRPLADRGEGPAIQLQAKSPPGLPN
jgi:hypothetical protein